MMASFIETWDSDSGISASIYQKSDQVLTVWIKLGVSLIEVPEDIFEDFSELVICLKDRIKEIHSDR